MVACTDDEIDALNTWNSKGIIGIFEKIDPLCICDMRRDSFLINTKFKKLVQEGAEKEGSSCGFFYVDDMKWESEKEEIIIHMGTLSMKKLNVILKPRIRFGRPLTFVSISDDRQALTFRAGEKTEVSIDENEECIVSMTKELLEEFCNVPVKEGTYKFKSLKNITLKVFTTIIRDAS